ncbi:MAG: alpha/beta hydrolase, partial [Bdellovibrionales bacterium]|nr:alpha/beta hydrolase [Bdellovibrionales bacterium]
MKTVFQQGRQFKSKKEIIVVLHGLGKSSSDLKYFMQEAEKKDDSVLAIDLHGFGETAVLNNNYKSETSIPYEYSRDDVFEILKQIPSDINIKLIGHSYGGGIALSILKKMAEENTSLNVTTVVLLSTFVKNLDKYYQDAALSGQNIQA